MKRNIALLLVLVLAMIGYTVSKHTESVEAQEFQGTSHLFAAQSVTGATTGTGGLRGTPVNHTIHLVVTGAPTGCTYRLQGSRDGTTWFNISASDITCTTTATAFETNKPTRHVRGNLLTLTGGTAPTVRLHYIGR